MAKEQDITTGLQPEHTIFALDIGTRSIIGIVGTVIDGKVNIVAIEKEEHTQRAMIDGQIENIEKVSMLAGKVKAKLEDKLGFRLSRVCVAAAGRALRTKRADFEMKLPGPQLIDDEMISRLEAGAIGRAEQLFEQETAAEDDSRRFYLVGYTVCQYYLDQYMISSLKDHRGKTIKADLIATFLPSEVVESLYTTMQKIDLDVVSITLEPIAAINAAIPENLRLLNLVMVDIGAGTSDIAVCTGGSVIGYTMATVAGDEITEMLMKEYLVDFQTAELMKAQMDSQTEITFTDILGFEHTATQKELLHAIQDASGLLCKEIAEKVLEVNGNAPSALFLAGGGSKLAGLKEGLTEALKMDANRVAIAGNNFKMSAFSEQYDLNNPEYATPLGIVISSGLNLINDSFRVTLNGQPAKLFRSGSFTALNLLMMNGYNFQDILARSGQSLIITVNGRRKIYYGKAAQPALLLINKKEGKLSDVIRAGDEIEFTPAIAGIPASARLGDLPGVSDETVVTLNGEAAPPDTPLKNGDIIRIRRPGKEQDGGEASDNPDSDGTDSRPDTGRDEKTDEGEIEKSVAGGDEKTGEDETSDTSRAKKTGEDEAGEAGSSKTIPAESSEPDKDAGDFDQFEIFDFEDTEDFEDIEDLEDFDLQEAIGMDNVDWEVVPAIQSSPLPQAPLHTFQTKTTSPETPSASAPHALPDILFQLNGSPLRLPSKEDGNPYYLMDMIQYSGIDLQNPKGKIRLTVNGIPGLFQQELKEGDIIRIEEEPA